MNHTHPNPEGNRARDQAGCRQPPRLPVPPAAAPYTHPVYGTQQVQQYPFPQTAPGMTGHLPPKKRAGWRIAVGVVVNFLHAGVADGLRGPFPRPGTGRTNIRHNSPRRLRTS
jgi:hypothetical protein